MDKNGLVAEWRIRLQKNGIEISQKKLKIALELLLDVVGISLATGIPIKLVGFGSLTTKIQTERIRRNPITSEEVHVPEKRVVKFKAGKTLLNRIQI
jgi:DNA-binding protein HU-beta